jgi:outer membrane receptor protein involved in Fe transport
MGHSSRSEIDAGFRVKNTIKTDSCPAIMYQYAARGLFGNPSGHRNSVPVTGNKWSTALVALSSALWFCTAASSAHAEPAPAEPALAAGTSSNSGDTAKSAPPELQEITVTAARLGLLGTASTSSEGMVTDQELQQMPQYRPGQMLETVPGLIVTLHSGEGKANQYLLRGYNLDHGTDLATFVDGMPINQPTHAHGQGYTDLNFMIPELADGITYTKGPYYANVGDFGAVGSVLIDYRNAIADQVSATVGTLGYQRIFSAGSRTVGDGHLLAAAEVQHYDGPFATPDDARKENLVLRYSEGDLHDGYSITGMYYHQLWTSTTDIPIRAIAMGLVPDRFGTLDPTDGGRSQRASLSAIYRASLGEGQFSASGFFIDNQLHLYNDFTHFLFDPVHGDQEEQFENRRAGGGTASYTLPIPLGAIPNEIALGGLARYDLSAVGRLPSEGQMPLPPQNTSASFSNHDQVYLFAGAAYVQATTHWTSTVRSVLGVRVDYQHGTDVDYLAALHETAGYTNGGTARQALLQPKGSLIYTPTETLEFYLSMGRGFHSADLRGVNQDTSVNLGLPRSPLLARLEGQEVGMRTEVRRNLALTFSVYNLWQQSETILDPDVGADSAGPPSRRYGYEINLTYQINRWLELYGSFSGNHTRFTRPFDDGTGHLGTYITDAPGATGSLALYLTDLGPWSGGLSYRYLGNYPLSSSPCVDSAAVHDFAGVATSCANAPTALGQVNGKGFGELNLDAHYAFASGWSASLGVYNVLNTHAAAAEFWYVDRLQNEIGSSPAGRADVHEHPLEPIMARFTISKQFGP